MDKDIPLTPKKPASRMRLSDFMHYDVDTKSWIFLGSIRAPKYADVKDALTKTIDNPDYAPWENREKLQCEICKEPVMPHYFSEHYCIDCYSWIISMAYSPECPMEKPEKFMNPSITAKHTCKDIVMECGLPGHDKVYTQLTLPATKTTSSHKLFLAGHQGKHVIMYDNIPAEIDPDRCEVLIYRYTYKGEVRSRLEIHLNQPVVFNGFHLQGKFTKVALFGTAICENAYLGKCASLNEHGRASEEVRKVSETFDQLLTEYNRMVAEEIDPKTVKQKLREVESYNTHKIRVQNRCAEKLFPNKTVLRELLLKPGICNMVPGKASNAKKRQHQPIFVGSYCGRCSEQHNRLTVPDVKAEMEKRCAELDTKSNDLELKYSELQTKYAELNTKYNETLSKNKTLQIQVTKLKRTCRELLTDMDSESCPSEQY